MSAALPLQAGFEVGLLQLLGLVLVAVGGFAFLRAPEMVAARTAQEVDADLPEPPDPDRESVRAHRFFSGLLLVTGLVLLAAGSSLL
jgi:hypothetical protein